MDAKKTERREIELTSYADQLIYNSAIVYFSSLPISSMLSRNEGLERGEEGGSVRASDRISVGVCVYPSALLHRHTYRLDGNIVTDRAEVLRSKPGYSDMCIWIAVVLPSRRQVLDVTSDVSKNVSVRSC